MFTGIIERKLNVQAVQDHVGGRRVVLPNVWGTDVRAGESIAVNGVCLTIARVDDALYFDCILETLLRTNLNRLCVGDAVNVERALQVGSRLDGHFVQGHIDTTGTIIHKIADEDQWRCTVEISQDMSDYLAPKGSVTLDGISLTIAALNGRCFDVAIIPTTLDITTIGTRNVGYIFNVEFDIIAKQIVTFLRARMPVAQ
jgi:riboflavin synthase